MDESIVKHLETPTAPQRFKLFAEAMLRGAAMTEPADYYECREDDENGKPLRTCAYFAMQLGLGNYYEERAFDAALEAEEDAMGLAYAARYGASIVDDYEDHGFTREQIAARIAAL